MISGSKWAVTPRNVLTGVQPSPREDRYEVTRGGHEPIDIGRVHDEPHDVGRIHTGGRKGVFQV
jgi:hypothetical protein